MIRLVDRTVSAVVACSHAVAAQFHDGRRRGDRTPVTTIHPPIADVFGDGDGAAFRRHFHIPEEARCVAAIGNVTPGRGQDLLIEALPAIRAAVPEARCLIVGPTFARPKDIAFERALRDLARELGVAEAVTFTGELERVGDAYAAAAVVVNPARTPESFGRVACEALVAGRPVVATRVGAVQEAVTDGGPVRLVPPGDPAAIASAAIGFLGEPEGAEAAARAASVEVLRRFAPERSLAAFREVIGGIVPIPDDRNAAPTPAREPEAPPARTPAPHRA